MNTWILGIVAAILIVASLIFPGFSAICLLATSFMMILFVFFKALSVVGEAQTEHSKYVKH